MLINQFTIIFALFGTLVVQLSEQIAKKHLEKAPTYKQFMQNMELKMQNPEFLDDTDILLRADAPQFNPEQASKSKHKKCQNSIPHYYSAAIFG